MWKERSEAQGLGNLAAVPQKVSKLGVEPILPLFLDLGLFPNFFCLPKNISELFISYLLHQPSLSFFLSFYKSNLLKNGKLSVKSVFPLRLNDSFLIYEIIEVCPNNINSSSSCKVRQQNQFCVEVFSAFSVSYFS